MTPGTFGTSTGRGGRLGAWTGRAVDTVGAAVWTASATPETGLGSAGAGVGDDEVAAVAGPPSACADGREAAPPVVRPSGSLVPMRIVSERARTRSWLTIRLGESELARPTGSDDSPLTARGVDPAAATFGPLRSPPTPVATTPATSATAAFTRKPVPKAAPPPAAMPPPSKSGVSELG